ncbi:MAG: hypothetical protein KDC12_07500 [Flavobacteriales bacterium]|nr:hypothetical protein [Flavobacteriales bacterium]
MKKLISLISALALISGVLAQESFNHLFGSTGVDEGNAVLVLENDEFMVAGSSGGFSENQDGYILHISADGTLLSTGHVGGANVDYLTHIAALGDNFLVVGTSISFGADYDIYWAIVDGNCQLIDQGVYDLGDWDFGRKVIVMDDGTISILAETYAGNTDRDIVLLNLNPDFSLNWSYQWELPGKDHAGDFELDDDGNFIIGGTRDEEGACDLWLLQVDPNGVELNSWIYPYEGKQSIEDILISYSNRIIAIGTEESADAPFDGSNILVTRYTLEGVKSWHTYWGGNGMDYGTALVEMQDHDFIVCSTSNSFGNGIPFATNMMTYRITEFAGFQSEGNITIGGNGDESIHAAALCADGGYVLVGSSHLDTENSRLVHVVKVTEDNQVPLTMDVFGDPNPVEIVEQTLVGVYPIPADQYLYLNGLDSWNGHQLVVTDAAGAVHTSFEIQAHQMKLGTEELPQGVYLLTCPSCSTFFNPIRFVVAH